MDTGCTPRQPATDLSHHNSLVRPGIRSTNPSSPSKLTATADQAGPVRGDDSASYVVCSHCGQVSHNLHTCDFCDKHIDGNAKVHQRQGLQQDCKRRLPATATANNQPCRAKLAKGTFYGHRTGGTQVTTTVSLPVMSTAGTMTVLKSSSLLAASVDKGCLMPGSALVVARAVPAPATNGRSPIKVVPACGTPRPLASTAGHTPAKLGRAAVRRGRREPECLTISSDEEMDVECQDETPKVVTNHHVTTTASRETSVTLSKEVHCLLESSPPTTPTVVVLTSQSSPPSSPSSSTSSVAASPDSTSVVVSSPRGVGRGGAHARATPVGPPPGGPPDSMRFRCRSIRVGSHKVAAGHHWVTATKAGFEFTLHTVQNEGREVNLSLGVTDVTKVLGHLSRNMPVLYLTTTLECGRAIREKLGIDRRPEAGTYDTMWMSRADERHKRITFLPDPALTDDQKYFLRTVFPGSLLDEIDQTSANEILIKSSPSSSEATANSGTSVLLPQCGSSSGVTHVVVQNVPTSNSGVARATRTTSSITATSTIEVPSGPNIKLLVYPPPPKTGGIPVHRADLRCLGEAQFLNDVIIDFYLKYLMQEKVCEEVQRRTHVFSSFFYPRLTQRLNHRAQGQAGLTPAARRHRNVRTWTRHVDIFAKDFIVVPINQNSHWFLAMVCFPGLVARTCPPQEMPQEERAALADQSPAASPQVPDDRIDSSQEDGESVLDSEPEEPLEADDAENPLPKSFDATAEKAYILILDSLRGGQGNKCRIMSTLREYLTEEWRAKKKSQLVFCASNMRGYTPMTPQQGNYSDCGVYLLQYVESFLENPPSSGKLMKLELGDWFPEDRVAQKRADIRDLILRLHMQQHPGSDFPAQWRIEEEALAAQQCLQVSGSDDCDHQQTTATTTGATTVVLTAAPVTNTIVLVYPPQPSSVS
ncbi:unnamed protein product [Ixodes hexagonus]